VSAPFVHPGLARDAHGRDACAGTPLVRTAARPHRDVPLRKRS
jgi:hypothetical protein